MRPFPEPTRAIDRTLLDHLQRQALDARSRPSSTGGQAQVVDLFVEWVHSTFGVLAPHFPRVELEQALQTPAYWLALESVGVERRHQIAGLVRQEFATLADTLDGIHARLKQLHEAWDFAGTFVVPDTNLYVHHPIADFRAIDWHATAEVVGGGDITLLVPMVVIDELDRIKDRRAGQPSKSLDKQALTPDRRAAATLKIFRDLFAVGSGPAARIDDGESRPGGAVHAELLADPLSHRRLDDHDSELIDRSLRVATLSGRPVRFVTGDNGAYFRAISAGLRAVHLELANAPAPRS